jgi:hypothetical protein
VTAVNAAGSGFGEEPPPLCVTIGWPGSLGLLGVTTTVPPPAAVAAQEAPPPPNSPMLLPHTCTGALTGAPTVLVCDCWVGSVPPVVELDGQLPDGSDASPTVLPQTVAGAVTGVSVLVSPSRPVPPNNPVSSNPVFANPVFANPVLDSGPVPSRPVPPAVLSPLVVAGVVESGAALLGAVPDALPVNACPICTEFPVALIGAVTGAFAVRPSAVVLLELLPVELLLGQLAAGLAKIATLLPQAVTGAAMGMSAETGPVNGVPVSVAGVEIGRTSAAKVAVSWVVSAEAIPAPSSHNPPTTSAP